MVAQRKKRKRFDSGTPSANDDGPGTRTPQGDSGDARSARKKKRKEKEQKEKGKEKAKAPTPEIQIFDYATAPNILDDVPPVEESDVRQTIRGARRGRGGGKRGKKRGALFFKHWPFVHAGTLLMLYLVQEDLIMVILVLPLGQ